MALTESQQKLKNGESTPDFRLKATDGNTYSLQDIKGNKATLILFMCNHCPFVLPKIDEIKRIAHDFKQKGLTVVGINANESEHYPEDSFEKMQEYFERWGINFYYLHDESQDIARAYGAVCTPDPFLVDRDLKLIFHSRIDDTHGKEEPTRHEMHEAIAEFLETGKITVPENLSMGCSIKWKF